MTDQQIAYCAEMIIEKYFYFKISEIRYVFRQAIMGSYGQLFDRLDTMTIMTWLTAYESERAIEIEAKRINEKNIAVPHRDNYERLYFNELPDEIKEKFASLKAELEPTLTSVSEKPFNPVVLKDLEWQQKAVLEMYPTV